MSDDPKIHQWVWDGNDENLKDVVVVIWGTNPTCHDSIHFYWLEDVSLLKYNIESFVTVACWYDKTYEAIHNMLTIWERFW